MTAAQEAPAARAWVTAVSQAGSPGQGLIPVPCPHICLLLQTLQLHCPLILLSCHQVSVGGKPCSADWCSSAVVNPKEPFQGVGFLGVCERKKKKNHKIHHCTSVRNRFFYAHPSPISIILGPSYLFFL